MLLRAGALVAVLANVVFNAVHVELGVGRDAAAITRMHDNLFVPASYAFGIWGVIYLSFVAYMVFTLTPGQRDVLVHDRVAPPLIAANLLMSLWVAAFAYDMTTTSVFIMIAILGFGITAYSRAFDAARAGYPRLWLAPFSLFLGWLSVATIANVALALVATGATHGYSVGWAIVMLAVAVGLSMMMALRFQDALFSGAVAWGSLALAVSAYGVSLSFTIAAAFAAALLSVLSVRVWAMRRLGEAPGVARVSVIRVTTARFGTVSPTQSHPYGS